MPFEAEVVDPAQLIDIGELAIRIATPEDLIIMKALARRPEDIADIGISRTCSATSSGRLEDRPARVQGTMRPPLIMSGSR